MSISLLPRVSGALVPKGALAGGANITSLVIHGVGAAGGRPQLPATQTAADESCPTCNLVEIPYNPSLPVLRL